MKIRFNLLFSGRRPHATNDSLVNALKHTAKLKTPQIEQCFRTFRRDKFVTPDLLSEAFEDHPVRVAKFGFNISAPHVYVLTFEALQIEGTRVTAANLTSPDFSFRNSPYAFLSR